ncbi:MAG: hypothetical protein AB8G05_05915 [Oligoflexales bacterium]
MSEKKITIEGSLRKEHGKGYCRRLRATGKVPGNILNKAKAVSIELEAKLLSKAWKAGKTFTLNMDGENLSVKIHELQINPIKRTAVHVDLMYV